MAKAFRRGALDFVLNYSVRYLQWSKIPIDPKISLSRMVEIVVLDAQQRFPRLSQALRTQEIRINRSPERPAGRIHP